MGSSSTKSSGTKILKNVHYDKIVGQLPRLDGKLIAITGTTTGTGNVAAETVLALGGELVLFNRKSGRSDSALGVLKEKFPSAAVTQINCDLSDFSSVREAAQTYLLKFGGRGLDVLTNNAGVMAFDNFTGKDGYDIQMQTNHLSHYLLTHLLFKEIAIAAQKRGEARIVNHASYARKTPPCKLDRVYLEKNVNGDKLGGNWIMSKYKRYQQSKLANVIYTMALHQKLAAQNLNIKALVAHPGYATTSLIGSMSQYDSIGTRCFASFANMFEKQSAHDGALPLLYCMASKNVKSGEFYGPNGDNMVGAPKIIHPEGRCTDKNAKEILISASDVATGVEFARM